MLGNKAWPAAALAAGLVALAACSGEPSVASKSAAAFEEAQEKGQTFGGEGHSHGHGGEPAEAPEQPAAGGEHQHHAGHEGMDHSAHGTAGKESPADHSAMDHGAGAHAGHAPRRSGSARPDASGHAGHAGHGAPPAQAPADHSGHAGHSAPAGGSPSATAPELPEQPASILRPDPVDAPAATSVLDAQRAAEMSGEHAGHGTGTYRHVDAGRGPEAHEGSEHHEHGSEEGEAALYVCPMHPEVTSKTPGTCPKCGMKLVERREG